MNEKRLRGTVLSRGFAKGPLYFIHPSPKKGGQKKFKNCPDVEISRFRNAVLRLKQKIDRLDDKVIEAHLLILEDPQFEALVLKKIEETHFLEEALAEVERYFFERAEGAKDSFFKDRFFDLRELIKTLSMHIEEKTTSFLELIQEPSILVCETLSPLLIAELEGNKIVGVISERGSETSHAAIMARARAIPYIVDIAISDLEEGELLLDGQTSEIIHRPTPKSLTDFEARREIFQWEMNRLFSLATQKSATRDGHPICLRANICFAEEALQIASYGAEGVGLFRSEYLLIGRTSPLTEDQQFHLYKSILGDLHGSLFTLRTYDFSPDKLPFGLAEISSSLKNEWLKTQLRALFRASLFGKVRLLFPMIADLAEWRAVKAQVDQVKRALIQENISFDPSVKVGVMIEIPSLALLSDRFMGEVDFVSIGTNDLSRFMLARNRESSSSGMHPAMIRILKSIIQEAQKNEVLVSLCGEMAADAAIIPLLIGMGISEFSIASKFLPRIKEVICGLTLKEAKALAKKADLAETEEEVGALLLAYAK